MLVRDEDVDASVAVEVAEDSVARVAAAGETEACCCLGEGPPPVEIVAVHGALTVSDEKEVQVAVVIEVDEERLARSLDVSNSGFRRHLHKRPVAAVAEQVTASLTTDDEEVQPAIVVVVREGGVCGTLRKGDARALGSVSNESALNTIEMCDGSPQCRRPHRDE